MPDVPPNVRIANFCSSMFAKNGVFDFSDSDLEELPLDQSEQHVLSKLGLPKEEVLQISFEPEYYGFRPLNENDFDSPIQYRETRDMLVFGRSFTELICLNKLDGGTVWSIMRGEEGNDRFVNTDLLRLLGCLAAYIELFNEPENCSQAEDLRDPFDLFKDRVQYFDPDCLVEDENYWSVVIEQMEYDAED